MPHSRQQQESQQIPVASFPPMGYGRVNYRSNDGMMHANRHHPTPPWMRMAQTSPHHHPSLMISQVRSASSLEDHHYRHVPAMSTVLSHDSASSAASSAKRDYFQQESPRQIAASVLMLANGRSHSLDERSRPLKKRKTVDTQVPMPCHVSPVSMHADDRTHVTQYCREDDDDNNSKATAASEVVPHFPSVLHMLLSVSKDGVLEWLEHGKAWRIVRWEVLRRSILPQFFPQLQSMDAFLAHISTWGFREVTEGPDVGAYTNEKFRRDLPVLCREMTLPKDDTLVRRVQSKIMNRSPRSILRVPSLSAMSSEKEDASVTFSSPGLRSPDTPNIAIDRAQARPGTNAWEHLEGRPLFVNYRPEGLAMRHSSIMPPYSPINIQSGRGRRSFFVSNRGRPVSRHMRSLPITSRSYSDDGSRNSGHQHPNSLSKDERDAPPSQGPM